MENNNTQPKIRETFSHCSACLSVAGFLETPIFFFVYGERSLRQSLFRFKLLAFLLARAFACGGVDLAVFVVEVLCYPRKTDQKKIKSKIQTTVFFFFFLFSKPMLFLISCGLWLAGSLTFLFSEVSPTPEKPSSCSWDPRKITKGLLFEA